MPPQRKGDKQKKKKTPKRNVSGTKVTVQTVRGPSVSTRRPRRQRQGAKPKISLSDCALKYALAIGDPWSNKALNSCVPVAAGLTQKMSSFVRGVGAIGTMGYGFLAISPCVANDCASFVVTDGAYVRRDMNPFTGGLPLVGIGVGTMFNSPYTTTQLLSNVSPAAVLSSRIVGVGARLWYTGKTIDMAGTVYSFRDPQHNSIQIDGTNPGAAHSADIGYFGRRRETSVENFDRHQRSISDFAFIESEQDMNTFNTNSQHSSNPRTSSIYPFSSGATGFWDELTSSLTTHTSGVSPVVMGIPTCGFQMIGTPGTSFNFEIMYHIEYGGPAIAVVGTRTAADPVGAAQVLDAANLAASSGQSNNEDTFWSRMVGGLSSATQAVKTHAVPLAQAVRMGAAAYNTFSGVGGLEYKEVD